MPPSGSGSDGVAQMLPLPLFANEDLLGCVDAPSMVNAMEQALVAMAAGTIDIPPREHLDHGRSTFLVMPGAGAGLFITKLVTVTPDNASRGLPVTQGLIAVLSAATGAPLALLDAAVLTAKRTGAIAAVGIKRLAQCDLCRLGVIGCGVQGAWAVIHAATVRPIAQVYCVARSETTFSAFQETIGRFAPHLDVFRCSDAAEMLRAVECVITATTSSTPVLPDDPVLLHGKLFVSIGSYRPDMQELPFAAFALARSIVVDSPQALTEAGDVINSIASGFVDKGAVFSLADLVTGIAALRSHPTRIFKTVGHAAFDLFAARAVLEELDLL